MISCYRIDLYDITDEAFSGRQIQGSIAFLDPFGLTAYHRFLREEPIEEELNPRELKILNHLATGLTSKEIADLLSLSKDTVDKSRKQMLLKTGTKNTVELVSRYMQQ
jgi:DNA-binding NarL/FixJ family response regulator